MEYEGEYILNASAAVVWRLLNDPDVLAKATPGIQYLEPLDGEGKYRAHYDVRLGSVAGKFEGVFHVTDRIEGQQFTLKVFVKGSPGTMDVTGTIRLEAEAENVTRVKFSGKAVATDKLARFGQRVLKASARMFTRQFFKQLEKQFILPHKEGNSGESKLKRRIKEWKSRSR